MAEMINRYIHVSVYHFNHVCKSEHFDDDDDDDDNDDNDDDIVLQVSFLFFFLQSFSPS